MGSSNSTTNHSPNVTSSSPEPSKIKEATSSTKKKAFIRLVRHISTQNSIPKEDFAENSIEEINDNTRINKTADFGKRITFRNERIYCISSLMYFC